MSAIGVALAVLVASGASAAIPNPSIEKTLGAAKAYAVVTGYRLCAAPDLRKRVEGIGARLSSAEVALKQQFGVSSVAPPIFLADKDAACRDRSAAIAAVDNYEQAVEAVEAIARGQEQ